MPLIEPWIVDTDEYRVYEGKFVALTCPSQFLSFIPLRSRCPWRLSLATCQPGSSWLTCLCGADMEPATYVPGSEGEGCVGPATPSQRIETDSSFIIVRFGSMKGPRKARDVHALYFPIQCAPVLCYHRHLFETIIDCIGFASPLPVVQAPRRRHVESCSHECSHDSWSRGQHLP